MYIAGIDWAERTAELCDFVQEEYGLDQFDVRILAASLLPVVPPAVPCWLICEGRRSTFFEALHGTVRKIAGRPLEHMDAIRILRPRQANLRVVDALSDRHRPWMGFDPHFEHPMPMVNVRNRYPELNSQCLRIRLDVPAIRMPHMGADFEFMRLLKLVLATEHRQELPIPWSNPPNMVLFAAKLLSILNPELEDGSAILRNLLMLPTQFAVMHGRSELTEVDHLVLYRVIRDSVRRWTYRVIQCLAEHDGAMEVKDIALYTGVERQIVKRDLSRLDEAGAVTWPRSADGLRRHKYVRLSDEWGPDIRRFVEGEMQWW